jgi:4-hydroxybenzoate polyprenyltransferase
MVKKEKRRAPRTKSRRDWPFYYVVTVLLGVLVALAVLTWKWTILGVAGVAILSAYMLKREWEG